MRTADVAWAINCNVRTVRRLRQRYRETGRTADRARSDRLFHFCLDTCLWNLFSLSVESYVHTNIYTLSLLKINAVDSERMFIFLLSLVDARWFEFHFVPFFSVSSMQSFSRDKLYQA